MGPAWSSVVSIEAPAAGVGGGALREFRFRLFAIDRQLMCGGQVLAPSPMAAARAAIERCAAVVRRCRAAAPGLQILEVGEAGSADVLVDLIDLASPAGRVAD